MKILTCLALMVLLLTYCMAQANEHYEEQHINHDHQDGQQLEEVPPLQDPDEQERLQFLKKADSNQDGVISFEQHSNFFHTYIVQDQSTEWDQYVKDYYHYLDENHDEVVTVEEFVELFEGVPEEQAHVVEDDEEGPEGPEILEDEL